MKRSASASRPHLMICPLCTAGELRPSDGLPVHCDSCARAVEEAVLRTLEQIACLPDALGSHACEECGHPQMKLLPYGVFHCPGCGSEVLPVISGSSRGSGSEAYRCGWADGFFGSKQSFVHNHELSRWEDAKDRLDYYQGHRAGRAARWTSDPVDERSSDRDVREAA